MSLTKCQEYSCSYQLKKINTTSTTNCYIIHRSTLKKKKKKGGGRGRILNPIYFLIHKNIKRKQTNKSHNTPELLPNSLTRFSEHVEFRGQVCCEGDLTGPLKIDCQVKHFDQASLIASSDKDAPSCSIAET